LSVVNNTEYQAHVGELIELPCGLASLGSKSRVSWWKNETDLSNMDKIHYNDSLIFQVSANDSGNYICRAHDDSVGYISSMLSLRVHRESLLADDLVHRSMISLVPTQCEVLVEQPSIDAGSSTELICASNSIERTSVLWQWYHDAQPIAANADRYTIHNASRKHMGMYQCCSISTSSDVDSCCSQVQIRVISKFDSKRCTLYELSMRIYF
jgi:hypothetical protein